jgi:hypothetical protein
MYSTWYTFFGVPLSQRQTENPLLQALTCVAEDGWSLVKLTPDLLEEYKSVQEDYNLTSESLEVLSWVVENKEALMSLDFALESQYSGSGDKPVWFGFSVEMPHTAEYEATKLQAKHANEQDLEKAEKVYALFKQASSFIADLFLEELGFYSIHGTS